MKKGIIGNILEYNQANHPSECMAAIDIFFEGKQGNGFELLDNEEVNGLFNEWLVFDFVLPNGKSLLENYLKNNFDNISSEDVKICTDLLHNDYGIYKIEKIWKDRGLRVKKINSGKVYDVKEKSLTRQAQVGNLVFIRVAKVGDNFEIVSANSKGLENIEIEEKVTQVWNADEEITPKTLFELFYNESDEGVQEKNDLQKMWKKKIDPEKAKEDFKDFLIRYNLYNFISVEVVQEWIKYNGTFGYVFRDMNDIFSIIASLTIQEYINFESATEELSEVLGNLSNITPQQRIGNKTPQEKRDEESQRKPEFALKISQIPIGKSFERFNEAVLLIKEEKFEEAKEEIELGMEESIENREVFVEIFRVIANYAVCFLAQERLEEGMFFLEKALELNPQYSFAQDTLEKAKQILENKQEEKFLESIENMYDAGEVEKEWSEEKILDKLKSIGVNVDKEELLKTVRKDLTTDNYWEKILLPQFKKAKLTENRWDEDFLWMATYALWTKWKKDDEFIKEDLMHIMDDFENILTEIEFNEKALCSNVYKLSNCIQHIPKKALKSALEYKFELAQFVDNMIFLLTRTSCADEIYKVIDNINKEVQNDSLAIFDILKKIENEEEWRKDFDKLAKKNKYDITLHIRLATFLEETDEDMNIEEDILKEALDIVEFRDKHKKSDIGIGILGETIFDAYNIVLDSLEELYLSMEKISNKKEIQKKLSQIGKKRVEIKRREEELMYSERNEKIEKKLKKLEREFLYKEKEEELLSNPITKYCDFLGEVKINFETEEKTEDKIMHLNKKNVGRNDPCPCGSGKKFKKCCL